MPAPGRNRILIWMCALIAVNQLGFGSIVPVIALYARSFDVLQSAIGVAIAVYGLARFLIALPAGQLADRLGRRNVLTLGGLINNAAIVTWNGNVVVDDSALTSSVTSLARQVGEDVGTRNITSGVFSAASGNYSAPTLTGAPTPTT